MMNIRELEKLSKQELFKMLEETNEKLAIAKTGSETSKTVPRLETKIKRIRRVLYECVCCADAKIFTTTDKHGNEKDFIRKDCGLEKCPYHDYFASRTKESEQEYEKLLKIFLKNG
jgi:hypothetical protein